MDIVFFGTPEIAIPILSTLHNHYNIKLLVCKSDKPQKRGQNIISCPTKTFALTHNIPFIQPSKLKNNKEIFEVLKSTNPDFIIVVAYGLILPSSILNIPKKASINVHFSLLPKYRGAAPVNWAVINGEKYTGVTTMLMNSSLDGGDILLQQSTIIDNKSAPELCSELATLGSKLIIKTINNFSNIKRKKQNEKKASYAPLLKKKDGLIDWSRSAVEIERRMRGLLNWPTAYSYSNGKLIKFYSATIVNKIPTNKYKPGEIVNISKDSFCIATGNGLLEIHKLQIEGKKILNTADFLRGYRIEKGSCFSTNKH